MIAYARTAALLAALWGLALLLDESVVIAAAISLALVATHAAIVLTRRRRERRNAAALIRGLRAQAESQLSFTRPDLIDEIGAMAEQFMGAVETLRSSHLGKQGSEALYAIPWYMIIGPPGSGKTTALRNSGLNFPLQAPQAGIRGFAGTRNCEWWLTNDGVLIDTAGRYTADDDHDEWLAFLDLLRSYRPRRPIEGVLVGVAVDDLGGIGEEQIVDRARQIRARINEVMKRLQVVTPVYVLFTKCDLIPGFVELFGPMTRSQRAEIWGFTFPVEQRGALGARFVECFARLTDAVEAHALRKLIDQRSVTGRARVACFGEQLRALGPNLGLFVNTLFTDNVYQETPILRGVYFTSGTQ
ncbi:MAG: type VI secretion system membrane subunit TssM, partial [Myxococcales bacterium]|nr:type VI secretion system membrane subunit TssM [Myxococcales bacterium]